MLINVFFSIMWNSVLWLRILAGNLLEEVEYVGLAAFQAEKLGWWSAALWETFNQGCNKGRKTVLGSKVEA